MNIALVTCPFEYNNSFDRYTNPTLENLGLEYIAAVLRKRGFNVCLFNASLQRIGLRGLVREIASGEFSLIGLYSNCANIRSVLDLLPRLPEKSHICLGGYSATLFYREFLKISRVDSIILEEGELPFLELAHALIEYCVDKVMTNFSVSGRVR